MSRNWMVIALSAIVGLTCLVCFAGPAAAGTSGNGAISVGPNAPGDTTPAAGYVVQARDKKMTVTQALRPKKQPKPQASSESPGIPQRYGHSRGLYRDPQTDSLMTVRQAAGQLRRLGRAVEREAVRCARTAMWNPTRYDRAYARLKDFEKWYYSDLGPGGEALRAWVQRQSIYYDPWTRRIVDDSAYVDTERQ